MAHWCMMLCRITLLRVARIWRRQPGPLCALGPALPLTARCEMSTPEIFANTVRVQGRFRLPDPPRRESDEMTQYDHLFKTGNSYHLAQHFGHPESTLVEADRWIVPDQSFNKARARRPDLLVAFDVDPQAYRASNGYVVSEQRKPPDFVLEVASESTADIDVGEKREDYAALGIVEYWRFDETGRHHGERLAGERLVDGVYVALEIEELPDGSFQGYSAALGLYIRWESGNLVFCDQAIGLPFATFADERARANAEHEARVAAEVELNAEREARAAAEARVRELEDRLRRQSP